MGFRLVAAAALAAVLAAPVAAPVDAHDASHDAAVGSIRIDDAFARATPGMVKNGAAYLTVTNRGGADRLIAAETPASARTELHTHEKTGDVMRMVELEDGVPLPAGETVTLAPGGLHVMLMGLKAPLKDGGSFPLTLTFETAGSVTIEVPIRKVGAMGGHDHSGHDHSGHDHSGHDHSGHDHSGHDHSGHGTNQ